MVNLDEIKEGQGKLVYESPHMTIKKIDFADIVTASPPEGQVPDTVTGDGETNPSVDPFGDF